MGAEPLQTLVIIQAAIGSAVVFDEVMNLVSDVWEVDDELAFESHMTSCGQHRPTGSV